MNEARTAAVQSFAILSRLPELIEVIGVLESEKVLGLRQIDRLWGPAIVSIWKGWEPVASELRRRGSDNSDNPAFFYFEKLAIKLIEERKTQQKWAVREMANRPADFRAP